MSESARHETIGSLLSERAFLSVRDVAALTGVSPATVRRDFEKLDAAGLAKKVHGGIATVDSSDRRAVALPFIVNRDIAVAEKRAIARAAGQIVRDGSLIIIHAGSTCFHFGAHVANRNLRVFTNSMPLAAYLAEHGTCQLTIGGGDLHREPGVLYDPQRAPDCFYGSQFFVGALGISSRGLLESHPLLVRFINDMVGLAHEIVVLVDSRKFAERPPTVALPLSRVSRVITDDGLADADARMLEDQGVDYMVAPTAGVAA